MKGSEGGSAKVQIGRWPVEKWKSEYRNRGQIKDYRLQSTEYGGKVGTWQDRLQSAEFGVQSAGGARERQLGWHAVPTLPDTIRTDVDWRTDATQSRPYPRALLARGG